MKRRFGAALRRILLAATAGALLFACNAPFIPVPPPDNIFVAQSLTDGSGTTHTVWITQGKADARGGLARFFIFDQALNNGVIATANADGTYVAPPLEGTQGDRVLISYTTPDGADSEVACRLLVEGDPAPPCPP